MKKIVLIAILLAGIVYTGSKIYTIGTKNQLAQVSSGRSITAGTLLATTVQAGDTILFSLTTPTPLTDDEISGLYLEVLGTNRQSFLTKVSLSGNTTTLSARISGDIPPKAEYEVTILSMPGRGDLNWFFDETLTVTAIPGPSATILPVTTQTENESEVTGFDITITQPNPKDPTLHKIVWTGAGQGIAAWQIKGPGVGVIKQLVYQSTFPVETSGY
ncbi:MAG: hypothetical protein RJB39_571, partial [Candidatus Parcubacteria bacterium]